MAKFARFKAKKDQAPKMGAAVVVKDVDQAKVDRVAAAVKASPSERAKPIKPATKKKRSKRAKKLPAY